MALYMNCFSLASVLPDLNYSLKHTSKLRYPETVSFRLRCLEFWDKHGLEAALDFAEVSKSTLYAWRKALEDSRRRDRMGRASLHALDPKSTRPIKCKSANWSPATVKYIENTASKHLDLGRQKLHDMLKVHLEHIGQPSLLVSESTVGRILKWLRSTGKLPSIDQVRINARSGKLHVAKRKKRIKKKRRADLPFKVKKPGDLIQIDGIEGYYNGHHYYIMNAIDYVTGVAFSRVFKTKSSARMASFLKDLPDLFGFKIKAIQTDNGSEYIARFHEVAETMGITHCFNYVKKPIYNGKVERFNRTMQEALRYDPDFMYNLAYDHDKAQKIIDDFIRFYNYERPHVSINHQPPMTYMLQCLGRNTFQKVLN